MVVMVYLVAREFGTVREYVLILPVVLQPISLIAQVYAMGLRLRIAQEHATILIPLTLRTSKDVTAYVEAARHLIVLEFVAALGIETVEVIASIL